MSSENESLLNEFFIPSIEKDILSSGSDYFPAGNYMFKVNNRNDRTRCDIFSKLTIKIPERR